MQDEQVSTVPYVYTSIQNVSLALAKHGIAKDRSNQQQGYKFRGIDDCLNALASLLPAHNLVIVPTVLEREVVERTTKSGGALFYVTVKVQFSFISSLDGSRHDAVLYGEAMDSADKATNKAMSAAYKYAVLLTFCVPTEGESHDADEVTHEVVAAAPSRPALTPSLGVTTLQFGRHVGLALDDTTIPRGYLQWLLESTESKLDTAARAKFRAVDEQLIIDLKAEIRRREIEVGV